MTQQWRTTQQAVDAAQQRRQQILHPAQPIETHALAHFHQQQARLPRLQGQIKYLAMADRGPAQPAGQPAIELTDLSQVQAACLDQMLEEQLVAGQRRVAKSRRQMLGGALMAVDPRIGLPAQVNRPLHLRAILQRPTQRIGPGGQRHTLALQAQPTVQSNGRQGHCGSTFSGKPSIYQPWSVGGIDSDLIEIDIVQILYDVGSTSISMTQCYIKSSGL
ncbi:hypothetical protein D9M71_389080 [compost metagenome]